jgi:hypothetical protein
MKIKIEKESLNELIAKCIDYTLYMGEVINDDKEKEKLRKKSERLRKEVSK